ncbi:Mannosyl phosphorylinositol ceramide synthase CSH1 [Porphyridium purpureum]|uniref:Mannosyl phosphorylinositol ceramide synthase CSH1 n=1 Tax=Porphyridium purpureum TaxID=35688 RepID=A0A5J4YZ57_PORPP|nr:Mannosyl phosphorylinositol ceramide synthase CSH1 [Porphyridium purpureum]|eukprot:POR8522..scf208_2
MEWLGGMRWRVQGAVTCATERLKTWRWPQWTAAALIVAVVLLVIHVATAFVVYWLPLWSDAVQEYMPWTEQEHETAWNYNYSHTAAEERLMRVPKIIHQIWISDSGTPMPERFVPNVEACKKLHPDYEYIMWTKESTDAFVEEHYPEMMRTWHGYKHLISRADAIRYMFLAHYGGIYFDVDLRCCRRLDALRRYDGLVGVSQPIGFANEMLVMAKNHPFMKQLVVALPLWHKQWGVYYADIMFSTGPMFLSLQFSVFRQWWHIWKQTHSVDALPVRAVPQSMWRGKNDNGNTDHFFVKFKGDTWHHNDTGFVFWLSHHIALVVITATCLALAALWICVATCLHIFSGRKADALHEPISRVSQMDEVKMF